MVNKTFVMWTRSVNQNPFNSYVLRGYMIKLSSDHSRMAILTYIFIVKQEVERLKVCAMPFCGVTVAPYLVSLSSC